MRAEDVAHAVRLQELVDDAGAEGVSRAPLEHLGFVTMAGGHWGAAHLGDIAKSSFSGSGSDHTRSAMGPSWGISGAEREGRAGRGA